MASRNSGGNTYRRYGNSGGAIGGGNRFQNAGTFKRGQISVDRKRLPQQQNGHNGPVNKISRFT